MEYNFYNKVTGPKGQYLKLTVSCQISYKNDCQRKVPRASVNTVITHNYDL